MSDNKGDLHQISAEIGGLKRSVEFMTDLWKSQELSATAGRRALHDKFDQFRQEVGIDISALSLRVDRLTDKVTFIEPSMKAFGDEELRQQGAKRLGAKLWGGMVLAAGLAGWGVHEFIGWFFRAH